MSEPWQSAIRDIHRSPWRAVLALTGGGSGAVAHLLAVPGASDTLLEAAIPYAPAALAEWLGAAPEQACSPETALTMASVACARAQRFAGAARAGEAQPLLGLGVTCALASTRPKRGAHRIHVAAQSAGATALHSLALQKGARDRRGEEEIAAQLALVALARACEVEAAWELPLVAGEEVALEEERPDARLVALRQGVGPALWSLPGGGLSEHPPERPAGLLCGSFNPLHEGHTGLRAAAERRLGGRVFFELSLRNADKPPLDFLSLRARRAQFDAPLLLTREPTFAEKARVAPGTTFVVGADTAARIVAPRFYGGREEAMREALLALRRARCRFLVAGRGAGRDFRTLRDVGLPQGFEDLFEEIPAAEFRCDVSSTQLRRSRPDQ